MMEIEFRGKGLYSNEWVYGFYYNQDDGLKGNKRHIVIYESDKPGKQTIQEPIDIKTLGQYTGEKDCNHRKIYQSDIYSDCMGYLYQVIFRKGMFCLLSIPDPFNHKEITPLSNILDSELMYEGNISDNPELLEVKI